MTNELVTVEQDSLFHSVAAFEDGQRMAKALATAKMLPPEFRNSLGDCLIAIELANRMGVSPFAVMQNVFPISGRPAFKSTFIISLLNTCGRYTPVRFVYGGEGEGRTCTITTTVKKTGEVLETTVTYAMAKQEGWVDRSGSKWQTMPDQMLAYRAASFFSRLYCPELLCGMVTADEVQDYGTEAGDNWEIVNDPVDELNKRFNVGDDPPEISTKED